MWSLCGLSSQYIYSIYVYVCVFFQVYSFIHLVLGEVMTLTSLLLETFDSGMSSHQQCGVFLHFSPLRLETHPSSQNTASISLISILAAMVLLSAVHFLWYKIMRRANVYFILTNQLLIWTPEHFNEHVKSMTVC